MGAVKATDTSLLFGKISQHWVARFVAVCLTSFAHLNL